MNSHTRTIPKGLLLTLVLACVNVSARTVVGSFAKLRPCRVSPADVPSGLFPDPRLLEFTGTNRAFDFADVTMEVETDVLQSFGSVDIREIYVIGDECRAGTNPTNGASSFYLAGTNAVGNIMVLAGSAVSGKTYEVWSGERLMDGAGLLTQGGIPGLAPSCTSTDGLYPDWNRILTTRIRRNRSEG